MMHAEKKFREIRKPFVHRDIKPDFLEAHYNLAIAYKQMGNLEAAIAEYRQAIRINPGFAEAIYNLGVTCQQKGQLRDAIACFERFIKLASPKYASRIRPPPHPSSII
jgi:tetratricopeptide (TPR) repeat protein